MRRSAIGALLAAALGVTACATYGDGYGGRDGRHALGGDYERIGNDCGAFAGPGGARLDPWLACTDEGRDLVRHRYARGGSRIGARTADEANIWFRRHADHNRDERLTDPEIKAALVTHARFRGMRR
jgi:hypothetical protein